MSWIFGRGSLRYLLAALLLASLLPACQPKTKVELKMQTDVVVLPPTLQGLEVRTAEGRRLADGDEVFIGDKVVIEGRGTANVTARVDAFGKRAELDDQGGGVYRTTVTVQGRDGGRETIGIHLIDPEATPPESEREGQRLLIRERIVITPLEKVQNQLKGTRALFPYDSHELDDAARRIIEDWSRVIATADRSVTFRIDGYCDGRGTQSYNKALGEMRATEVRKLLVVLGVDDSRLSIISIGSDRATDCSVYDGDRERECFSKDRRVELTAMSTPG